MRSWLRMRLSSYAGTTAFWEDLRHASEVPEDLQWAIAAGDEATGWVSPESLAWVARRPGYLVVDDKGCLPLHHVETIDIDFERALALGTGMATAAEVAALLPNGWRLVGTNPRKIRRGDGRWRLPIERYQQALFPEITP